MMLWRVTLFAAHTAVMLVFLFETQGCTLAVQEFQMPRDAFVALRTTTDTLANIVVAEWLLMGLALLYNDERRYAVLAFVYAVGAHGAANSVGCSGCPVVSGNVVQTGGIEGCDDDVVMLPADPSNYCPVPRFYTSSMCDLDRVEDHTHCWLNGCSEEYSLARARQKWALLVIAVTYSALSIKAAGT